MVEEPKNDSPLPRGLLVALIRGKKYIVTKRSQADPGPQSVTPCPSQQEFRGKPNQELGISSKTRFQLCCLQHPFPAPCGDGGGQSTVVWQYLLMIWSLGRSELSHLIQKNPEVFLKCKRSRNWSFQLHNWGKIRELTAITFNFFPKNPEVAKD